MDFKKIAGLLDRYDEKSELSKINRAAGVEKVASVDVTTDLSAIENEKAAAYWANLEKDLEAAIGLRIQDKTAWTYEKGACCRDCRLEKLCAGLYQLGVYYSEEELCPVFTDPAWVARRVREDS